MPAILFFSYMLHSVSRMQLLKYIVQNVLIMIFWNDQLTDQPLLRSAFDNPTYLSGLQVLKGHSQLWDRATLDTSFLTLKKGYLNPRSKLRVEYIYKYMFCAIFNRSLKNRFLSVLLFILWWYFITFGLKQCGSRLQKNMDRRGGKSEGAGRKKSPALAKITREINQKH